MSDYMMPLAILAMGLVAFAIIHFTSPKEVASEKTEREREADWFRAFNEVSSWQKSYRALTKLTYSPYDPMQVQIDGETYEVSTAPRPFVRGKRLFVYVEPNGAVQLCDRTGRFVETTWVGHPSLAVVRQIFESAHTFPDSTQGLINGGRPIA